MTNTIPLSPGTQAVWRNANYDQPVVITGVMGDYDGEPYYATEGNPGGTPASQILLGGEIALRWLAEQGATFVLPRGRTKGTDPVTGHPTLEKEWQNKPKSLEQAIAHSRRGGNVGLLNGEHSSNIVAIDRDVEFSETVVMLGPLANTVKIKRDNAPDRGKFLYRISGELPKSAVWKINKNDKHPAAEFLSNNRHSVIPPSQYDSGNYELVDTHYGILELTPEQMELIWWLITGESLDKAKRNQPEQKTEDSDYVQRVRDVWTTQKVFEHFNRTNSGTVEGRTETRILGNGGLLINDWRWYCHSDSVGGDQFDAWAYCRWKKIIDRSDAKMFWDVASEMGDEAGIKRPVQKKKVKSKSASQNTANSAESADSDSVEESYSSKPKQADLLYRLVMDKCVFFTGRQDSHVYASVEVDGHRESYRMRSGEFSEWMAYAYFAEHGTTVGSQAMEDCKKLLSFEAKKTIADVFVRVGQHMGKVYIDIGSPDWNAIEVDKNGWRIVVKPPVFFRRSSHMLPLASPVECPEPLLLQRYLNIEQDDWPLVAGWVIQTLHPTGPFPIIGFFSRAGSAKSTQLRVFKRIIDPSSAELRSQPEDTRDLFIAASNSWLLAFDNVGRISPEVADALCVISTGGGYTRKSNYTDDVEMVINVQRPIAINGIGDVVTRADLMDRTIVISTPAIPETERKDENEFWEKFEQDRPKILGAFLHALSVGLANIDSVKLEKKPRMADFAKLAVAAETAYTDGGNGFLEAYTTNRENAAEVIIENSPLGDVLCRIATSTESIMTPEELLLRLNVEAKDYEKNAKIWPKAPCRMKNQIERLAPALERQNVRIEHKRANGKRSYRLVKLLYLVFAQNR